MGTARGAIGGVSRAGIGAALQTRTPNTQAPFEAYRKLYSSATVPGDLSALFRNGELGAWYDVSDMSTLFQDAAGTIPVTDLSQPVGLMLDKSKGQPTITVGEELLKNTSFDGATDWTRIGATTVLFEDGVVKYVNAGGGNQIHQFGTYPPGLYAITFTISNWTSGSLGIRFQEGGTITAFASATMSNTTFTFYYNLTIKASRINFEVPSGTSNFWLDNVSARLISLSPDNHVTASTAATRPTLEARHNRLIQTELFNGAAWSLSNITVAQDIVDVAAPNGTLTAATLTATANSATITQAYTNPVSNTYTFSVWMRRRTGTGTIGIQAGTGSYTTVTLTNDWQRFSVTSSVTTTGVRSAGIQIGTSGDELDVWGAQLELYGAVSEYQRVTSATNYEDIGLPRYLQFDGVDDRLNARQNTFLAGTSGFGNGVSLFTSFQADGNSTNDAYIMQFTNTGSLGVGNPEYKIGNDTFFNGINSSVILRVLNSPEPAVGFTSANLLLPSTINRTSRRLSFLGITVGNDATWQDVIGVFSDGGKYVRISRQVPLSNHILSGSIFLSLAPRGRAQFYGGFVINRCLSVRESMQVTGAMTVPYGLTPNFQ